MDTLDTLFAYSQGDTRLDTLESLYNYSREEMNYVGTRRSTIKAQTKAPTSIGSTSTPDTEKEMPKCDDPQRQLADDSRDETAIQEFVETKEPELGVLLTRVTDNLACCTRNIRVSDYMDEAFLEDDFHELVYRPSRRPGALHNALTTSPSYDEGLIKPVLSNITESDEKTVHTLDTTKTKELSTKNIASLYMDYANWSRAFCGDI
ncbi:unnamed protein product [Cylindrotheca closterium]|uniref:Uncharacterized protein n=1 Tax=Cylindrotheca closterium TaxID=2856 RepID=A0AAD2FGQ7_9STRA|nr:unnamed protein product [Cylindrotheca closterium]